MNKVKAFWKNKLGEGVWECFRNMKRTFPFLVHPILYKEKAKEFKKRYTEDMVYFFGSPPHGNLGDSAIAAATVDFLKRNGYAHVYEIPCTDYYLVKRLLKRHKRGHLICLIGGGNMGDAYLSNEVLRRDVIRSFPRNKIVIFPQTIDYSQSERGKRELQKSVEIYGRHQDLTLLAREKVSLERMKKYYSKNKVYMVPDIVLSWKQDFQDEILRENVLFCVRKDSESRLGMEGRQQIFQIAEKYFPDMVETDTWIPGKVTLENRDELVMNKLLEFRKAKLVITDRLHGMIFAAITGTPCIVLPNSNHKTESEYEWLKELEYIYLLREHKELGTTIEYFKENICQNSYEGYCADKEFEALEQCLHRVYK